MVRAVVLIIAVFLTMSQALACGILERAEPKVGSVVGPPDHLTLHFSQAFDPAQSDVTMTDSNEAPVKLVSQSENADHTVLSVQPAKPLQPGKYKVVWDVLWMDCGQKTQGDYKFTVQ